MLTDKWLILVVAVVVVVVTAAVVVLAFVLASAQDLQGHPELRAHGAGPGRHPQDPRRHEDRSSSR
eukprot:16447777-Heterocapsa_arctica.AAC.1